MKKFLLLFLPVLFAVFQNSSLAQSQISTGIGTSSIPEFAKTFSDLFGNIFTFGNVTQRNQTKTNALFFTYRYYLQDRFSLEGSFTYERFADDLFSNDNKIGSESDSFYSIIAGASYKYFKSGLFSISGELEAGVSDAYLDQTVDNKSESQSTILLGLQITPLLFSFGNSLGVNAGLGFGYKGVFRGSVFYSF